MKFLRLYLSIVSVSALVYYLGYFFGVMENKVVTLELIILFLLSLTALLNLIYLLNTIDRTPSWPSIFGQIGAPFRLLSLWMTAKENDLKKQVESNNN